MKKIFISSLLYFSVLTVSAESRIEVLFDKYKSYEHVTYVHMPKLMIFVGSVFVDDKEAQDLMQNVNSVSVMSIDDSNSSNIRRKVSKEVDNLLSSGYDLMTVIKDNGSDIRLIVKSENGLFSDLIIFVEDKTSSILVHLEGELNREDFDGYVKIYGSEQ